MDNTEKFALYVLQEIDKSKQDIFNLFAANGDSDSSLWRELKVLLEIEESLSRYLDQYKKGELYFD